MLLHADTIRDILASRIQKYKPSKEEKAHLDMIGLAIQKAQQEFDYSIEYEIPIKDEYKAIVAILRDKGYKIQVVSDPLPATLYISWL